jgi:hypothetical protein
LTNLLKGVIEYWQPSDEFPKAIGRSLQIPNILKELLVFSGYLAQDTNYPLKQFAAGN